MWSDNSSPNWHHTCYTPYSCTCCHASLDASNPMTQWYHNVLPNSSNLLTYQGSPENPNSGFSHVNPLFHVENDQEATDQIATKYNEIDSWLLLNPDHGQDQNNLNPRSYRPWTENQYQSWSGQLQTPDIQQVSQNGNYGMLPFQSYTEGLAEQQQQQPCTFYQGIQNDFSRAAFNHSHASCLIAPVPQMGDGIVSEATIGSVSNTLSLPAEWELNQFSIPFLHPGNIIDATIGSHSNSNSISSEGTQQLISRAATKKLSKFPPMSRRERVLRYLEKKKARKYEKKIEYSSRRTYAQTRPRIRGRFARNSQTGVQ